MQEIYKNKTKVLAPLVGGSDLTFRLLSRKYGAEVTFTEMCVANLYLDPTNIKKRYVFEFDPSDRPLILQVAGNSADPIIKFINLPIFEGNIDGVDLNCGCPQGFALEKGYGSAMLRDPDHLVSICKEIVANTKYPLSVKLRLHESVDHTIDIMKRLKEVGVKAFSIHARYYWQKGDKRGKADWDAIKKMRDTFPDIPIIGNGNIGEYEDFQKIISFCGVNAGMAGYGALVKPSIFGPKEIPIEQRISDYLNLARRFLNGWIDVLRHVEWMLKSYSITSIQKTELFKTRNLKELGTFLESLSPPIRITLEELKGEDKITYPKQFEEMSTRERVKFEKRKEKQEENIARKKKFKTSHSNPSSDGKTEINPTTIK